MRVPIPIVILLILAVVAGTWWERTRQMDFLTPPSEARLEEIRIKAEASVMKGEPAEDVISAPQPVNIPAPLPSPPPVEQPKIDLGDLSTAPSLQSYAEISPQGSAHLIELATALEQNQQPQRALLAWERVVDLTKPDANQANTATAAIRRLRAISPMWNLQPDTAISLTLHASTGKKQAKSLQPVLDAIARELETASSGILKVKTAIKVGKTSSKGPAPIALWMAGPDLKSTATEVISFKVDSPDLLQSSGLKTCYQLVVNHLTRATAYTPPPSLTDAESAQDALSFRITRLCWSEFAAALNAPVKKVK